MFRTPDEIRDAYRDEQTAQQYVARRFQEPLGALLHDRQVTVVRRLLAAATTPRVLELAPGPARVTVDVAPDAGIRGIAMDASFQMLTEARRRLQAMGAGRWNLIQGDAFRLPFLERFDVAYSFRLIRHFEDADRHRLYRELHRVLKPGGMLVFDAINETVSAPLRQANPGDYQHYDALLRPDAIARELDEDGFDLVSLDGVQHRYRVLHRLQTLVAPRSRAVARGLMEVVERSGGEPLEWIVTCRRR